MIPTGPLPGSLTDRQMQDRSTQRLVLLFAGLGLLNLLAWLALWGLAGAASASVISVGALAWFLGLRHAFDADHIAAIDNVTRKLRQDGKRSVTTGLFFALGHSTIVILLSFAIALEVSSHAGRHDLPKFWGGLAGTLISAGFLTLIGIVNLVIFVQLWGAFDAYRARGRAQVEVDQQIAALLDRRGLAARLFRFLYRRIDAGWKMYFVGLLFGLGFDTATEVALLGISATAAASHTLPFWGIMVFPLMFTAGMTLMDALDGAFMMQLYDWAFADGLKKLFFNTAITGLTVLVAFLIGGIEWLQVLSTELQLSGRFWTAINNLDFAQMGAIVVALITLAWLIAWRRYRRLVGTIVGQA